MSSLRDFYVCAAIVTIMTSLRDCNADEANRIHLYIEANPGNWAEDEENK